MVRYKVRDRVSPRHKHCDIIGPITILKERIQIDIKGEHVKGHQDDLVEFEELDRMSQLNVMMDLEAKEFMKELKISGKTR